MKRERYIVPSATQTAVQIDTFSNLTDLEFSDFGSKEKKPKAKKTPFKNLFAKAKAKVAKLAANRKTKRDERQTQKMIKAEGDKMRALNMQLLLEKNPKYIEPVEMVKAGIGSAADEKMADEVIKVADEMKATGAESAPLLGEDIPTNNDEKKSSESTVKTGWKDLSTPKKVGIIGGSAILISIIIYAVTREK